MRHLILCYHAISASWPSPLAVSQDTLSKQLGYLRDRGYQGLTFAAWERHRVKGTLPKRSVVVTFDDGYKSTLLAREVMDGIGYPGTVFPVLNALESGSPLKWEGISGWADGPHAAELEPLTWSDLVDLKTSDWEIGSHTVTHPDLTSISEEDVREELKRSKAVIEERLGSCESLAYPYGLANKRVAAVAEQAGFVTACTLTRFHHDDSPLLRGRVGLYPADRGIRMRVKFSSWLDRFRRSGRAAAVLGNE